MGDDSVIIVWREPDGEDGAEDVNTKALSPTRSSRGELMGEERGLMLGVEWLL
jgi:hypothetical protein